MEQKLLQHKEARNRCAVNCCTAGWGYRPTKNAAAIALRMSTTFFIILGGGLSSIPGCTGFRSAPETGGGLQSRSHSLLAQTFALAEPSPLTVLDAAGCEVEILLWILPADATSHPYHHNCLTDNTAMPRDTTQTHATMILQPLLPSHESHYHKLTNDTGMPRISSRHMQR